jgi:hypothetical protein
MRTSLGTLAAWLLVAMPVRAQEAEIEALKKRVSQLEQETEQLHRDVAGLKSQIAELKKEPAGNDPSPAPPTASLLRSRLAANHSNAMAALKSLVVQEGIWRYQDFDGNGVADYWVRDIAAFRAVHDKGGRPVELIDRALAKADAAPAMKYPELEGDPAPKQGYFFKVVKADGQGNPFVTQDAPPPKAINVPPGPSTNATRFAFCAFPAKYGEGGKLTFIVCEDGILWQKDLGPEAKGVEAWPQPQKPDSGWSKVPIGW